MLRIMCLNACTRGEQVAWLHARNTGIYSEHVYLIANRPVWAHLLLGQAVLVKLDQRPQELRVCHHRLGARPADILQVSQNDHTLAHLASQPTFRYLSYAAKTMAFTLTGSLWFCSYLLARSNLLAPSKLCRAIVRLAVPYERAGATDA